MSFKCCWCSKFINGHFFLEMESWSFAVFLAFLIKLSTLQRPCCHPINWVTLRVRNGCQMLTNFVFSWAVDIFLKRCVLISPWSKGIFWTTFPFLDRNPRYLSNPAIVGCYCSVQTSPNGVISWDIDLSIDCIFFRLLTKHIFHVCEGNPENAIKIPTVVVWETSNFALDPQKYVCL